ncbi:MAG: YbaB/EbfC family nucleoid-associated protein [Propionibacteriaceae bacterium]
MEFDPDQLARQLRDESKTRAEDMAQARADVEPIVTSDSDDLVEIEITVDLEVTRVTLGPRATRDPQKLEDTLVSTFTEAIKQARAADPSMAHLEKLNELAGSTLEDRLAEAQTELTNTMQAAEQKMATLKQRLSEHRTRATQRRQ